MIVVTGIGTVTGFGYGLDALTEGLLAGRSCVRPQKLFAELDGETNVAGYVADVPPDTPARANHFIRAAVDEAIRAASLPLPLAELAVFVASIHGNIDAWWRARATGGPTEPRLWQLGTDIWPSIAERVNVTTISTGCTSSAMAIGQALDHLRAGLGPSPWSPALKPSPPSYWRASRRSAFWLREAAGRSTPNGMDLWLVRALRCWSSKL